MEEEDLSPEERRAFDQLSKSKNPPKRIEKELVPKLKDMGLIKTKNNLSKHIWIYLSAASVVFLIGFFLGIRFQNNFKEGHDYMMILLEDKNFRPTSSDELAQEYAKWNEDVRETGVKIIGQELWNETREITSEGVALLEEDYGRRITGYFLFQATSENMAITLAEKNPHIKYGGIVQLKKIRIR